MQSRDAAGECVGGVEEGGVGIGHFDVSPQHFGRHLIDGAKVSAALEQLDGGFRPDRPVPEQPADDATIDEGAARR